MVCDQGASKVHFNKRLHELEHVRVAVVHEGFHEIGYRSADIAKMNLPELVHFREGARGFEYIFAHLFAAFHPGPRAETHADVGTVGNLQRPYVAIEVPEHATR